MLFLSRDLNGSVCCGGANLPPVKGEYLRDHSGNRNAITSHKLNKWEIRIDYFPNDLRTIETLISFFSDGCNIL